MMKTRQYTYISDITATRESDMKLPSQAPANYKTERGLFNAFVRALNAPNSVNRSWWLCNAMHEAERRSEKLLSQFRRLSEESSPKTLDNLIPVGHSRP